MLVVYAPPPEKGALLREGTNILGCNPKRYENITN